MNTMLATARLGFALSITLHYLFPMITIGGLFWLLIQSLTSRVYTLKNDVFRLLFFVLVGITTGYVLKWHFSTFWPKYLEIITLAFDPLLGIEAMVSIGGFVTFSLIYFWAHKQRLAWLIRGSILGLFMTTLVSTLIITSVNSWMQFPTGIRVLDHPMGSRLEFGTLRSVFFNPTYTTRLAHTLLGALMLGITFQAAVSRKWTPKVTLTLMFLWFCQFLTGHQHAAESYHYQPEKFAAFEGHGATYSPADLWLLPGVNERYNIRLPGMTSFLLFYDSEHPVAGTNAWKEEYLTDRAEGVFKTYHIMVLSHFAAFALLLMSILFRNRSWALLNYLPAVLFVLFLLANFAGWYTTEWGRQPWLIRGILKTSDAVATTDISPMTGVGYSVLGIVLPVLGYLSVKKWSNNSLRSAVTPRSM